MTLYISCCAYFLIRNYFNFSFVLIILLSFSIITISMKISDVTDIQIAILYKDIRVHTLPFFYSRCATSSFFGFVVILGLAYHSICSAIVLCFVNHDVTNLSLLSAIRLMRWFHFCFHT